ncbi:DUF7667 family protein [Paenibacillus senegalensis]|uniref:DUF7667 family protein n=1 Tax=Paenibacillus senegalensis TaxID=1465766 RepID=UPI000289D563|nr:hypothetical protein [Paenibacillus senegalensis]
MIEAVGQRIAELWTYQKRRQLTDDEYMEFTHCMNANAKHWWELAYLKNLSLMASMTNDVPWQHEVCLEMDDLQQGIKEKAGAKGHRLKREHYYNICGASGLIPGRSHLTTF